MLSMAGLAGLLWHVMARQNVISRIPAIIAGGLWLCARIYIYISVWVSGIGASVEVAEDFQDVTKVRFSCERPIRIFPGSYFYLFPPGKKLRYDYFNSHLVMPVWYALDKPQCTRSIEFLIPKERRGLWFRESERWLLDGPYAHDLALQRFDNVILAAKGIGISGVLPFARGLIEREGDDQGSARTISVLWRLERNNQDEWVASHLKRLQTEDTKVHNSIHLAIGTRC